MILKLLLENKMTQRQAAEVFNVTTTNVKARHTSNAQTTKILIMSLTIYVKIRFGIKRVLF